MADEQTPQQQGVQDPAQAPAAPPAAPVQPQTTPQVGPGPWAEQLQQTFDPETAARVDAFLRSSVQPHVTRLEQQYAQTEGARQMLDAFQRDPDAANVAVNRELYGDVYADQLAASLGRTDLLVGQQPAQPQQPAQQAAEPQQGWREDPVYQAMAERIQQEQYDSAKQQFLSDPQYADINADLFDPFVAGAETWEDAVNAYRSYAAQFAQNAPAVETQQVAPPTLGSEAGGAPGSTPSYPRETLDEAIDAIFSENKPIAPPVMGQ